MAIERITDTRHMLHWPGHMETDYIYTLGIACEKFFIEIKENGRILGAKCKHCSYVFVPPKLFCEKCFAKLTEWVDVGTQGVVYTFTVAHIDINGAELKEPVIYALIIFDGAEGGLVHKVGDIKPNQVKIGMKVEAVFKPQPDRTGNINDIQFFKPKK
jgi:uncharacterized OB-fold protein